jgi:hypothetical protein
VAQPAPNPGDDIVGDLDLGFGLTVRSETLRWRRQIRKIPIIHESKLAAGKLRKKDARGSRLFVAPSVQLRSASITGTTAPSSWRNPSSAFQLRAGRKDDHSSNRRRPDRAGIGGSRLLRLPLQSSAWFWNLA